MFTEGRKRLAYLDQSKGDIQRSIATSQTYLNVIGEIGEIESRYIGLMVRGISNIQALCGPTRLDLYEDIKGFYQLKISNSKSYLEILRSVIAGIEQFGLVAETDIFNNMEIIKSDLQRMTSAGKMVERAKQGYVDVRKREFEVELDKNMDEKSKKGMIEFMKDEKKWAYEGLAHEVKEFNEMSKFSDDNFDQFLINKDEFHIQMEMRCKQAFLEIIDESKRLNDNIFEGMKESTDRISKDLEALTKLTKRNQAERAMINGDGLEEATEDGKEEAEEGEETQNVEDKEGSEQVDQDLKENVPPLRKRAPRGPKITADKIIEYIDKALDNLKNGVQDDDANANEVSSLTNQFKFINSNMKQGIKSKLTNIFTKNSNSASDLKHFLTKVLQGAPVQDFQVEKLCNSFDDESMRNVTSKLFEEYANEKITNISFSGLSVITKLFLMKCTPKRDWKNLSNFLLSILAIERNSGFRAREDYISLTEQFRNHYLFKIEEFWVGCLVFIIKKIANHGKLKSMEGLSPVDRLKKIVKGIVGNNKKMMLFAFGDEGETALGQIIEEIAKEVFAGDLDVSVEIKKAVGEMNGVDDLLLCVKI